MVEMLVCPHRTFDGLGVLHPKLFHNILSILRVTPLALLLLKFKHNIISIGIAYV
jgi:hypothetical protein